MNKIVKIIFVTLFSLLLCFLSYKFCYFIAQNYFFDKIFYQKSITFGYRPEDHIPLTNFGRRAKDLISLENTNSPLLKYTDTNKFKIALIGDSFAWGNGLKNSDRFAVLLEKKLNKIRPTRVFSYAKPSWDIFEYFNAYQKIKSNYSPDLIIFSLVNNDIFVDPKYISDSIVSGCTAKNKNILPIHSIVNNPTMNIDQINRDYTKNNLLAWSNPTNICVLDYCLNNLPTQNAIYFTTEDYNDNWNLWDIYRERLNLAQKYIVSSSRGKEIPKYAPYWKTNPYTSFLVSKLENHPNSIANQMYADILFNEITTNPKWNYIK